MYSYTAFRQYLEMKCVLITAVFLLQATSTETELVSIIMSVHATDVNGCHYRDKYCQISN